MIFEGIPFRRMFENERNSKIADAPCCNLGRTK